MDRDCRNLLIGLLISLSHFVATASADAKSAGYGAVMASPCKTCHQLKKDNQNSIPSLSGYTYQSLIDFYKLMVQDTKGSFTIMSRIARGYTLEEWTLLSSFLANN